MKGKNKRKKEKKGTKEKMVRKIRKTKEKQVPIMYLYFQTIPSWVPSFGIQQVMVFFA